METFGYHRSYALSVFRQLLISCPLRFTFYVLLFILCTVMLIALYSSYRFPTLFDVQFPHQSMKILHNCQWMSGAKSEPCESTECVFPLSLARKCMYMRIIRSEMILQGRRRSPARPAEKLQASNASARVKRKCESRLIVFAATYSQTNLSLVMGTDCTMTKKRKYCEFSNSHWTVTISDLDSRWRLTASTRSRHSSVRRRRQG